MPALVSHHHFAVSALHSSEPHVVEAAKLSANAFRWGAQGPDILFFHHILLNGKTSELGHTMHKEKIYRAFKCMIAHAAKMNEPILLSYLLGFACHYTLDRSTHPFVNYIADYRLNPSYDLPHDALHSMCEADIDAAVITNYISGDQQQYEAYKLLEVNPQVANLIGQLLTHVGWEIYGIRTKPSRVESAMRSMILAYSILHDGNGKQRMRIRRWEQFANKKGELSSLVRPIEPLLEDCPNLNHGSWIDPVRPGVRRYESFFDLLDQSVASASELMNVVYDCYHKDYPLSSVFFDLNYNGLPEESKKPDTDF